MGIGGEYPLSATVTSEGSEGANRGRNVSSVFAMQGVGNVLSSLVMYVLLVSPLKLDLVWRFALGFGAVPGLSTVYFRWQMGESKHFAKMQKVDDRIAHHEADAEGQRLLKGPSGAGPSSGASVVGGMPTLPEDQQRIPGGVPGASRGTYGGADVENVYRAEGGSATPGSVVRAIGRVEHRPPSVVRKGAPAHHHATGFMRMLQVIYEFRWVLMGTAGSWLIFDITFYANGLFSGTILESIGIAGKADADHLTQHDLAAIALTNIIITCIGLPGYITAVLCIDRIGRRNLQLLGFTAVAVVFVLMGAFLTPLEGHSLTWLFVALYGLTFFFANFGPNTTTFVIPSESFPTRARATCHGLSAASGKMGAVIGGATLHPLMETYGSAPDQQREGLRLVLFVCAAVSLAGTVWTFFFTKDMGSANLAELDKAGAADDAEEREAYDAVVTPGGFSIPELSAADSVLSEDGGEVGAGSRRFGSKPASSVNTPEGKVPLLAGSPQHAPQSSSLVGSSSAASLP